MDGQLDQHPAFTLRTYVHAQNDALKGAAATLQRVVTPRDSELAVERDFDCSWTRMRR